MHFGRSLFILLSAAGFAGITALASLAERPQIPPDQAAFFESKVRPILVENCYACHSAASKPVMGGLRLDTKGGILTGGGHGPAVFPAQPEKSLLIKAVRYADTLKMPPKGKLSDSQIATLTEWVRIGAPDTRQDSQAPKKLRGLTVEEGRKYWAFQPLKLVTLPRPTGPTGQTWVRSPIDRFVLDKLVKKGLKPSPVADRRTLIRRAYFDLIGLPPTPEEVEAFLNDAAPGAWKRVIDKLLASPHYGERWGRHWLDLARFAESHGYEQDYDRPNAYHYRDFVIKALNQDMPYDQFVRWQLAGDEFEPENPMALMATGFLAAGTHATQITKNQVEKERYDELDDMLSTTSTAFLGLTFGCARCHDHKYDAIPNQDYYRMLSTFTTTVRSDYDVNMDPLGYRTAKNAFDVEHAPLVDARTRFEKERLPGSLADWLKTESKKRSPAWLTLDSPAAKSAGGAEFTLLEDGSIRASGKLPDTDTYTITATATATLKGVTSIRLEAMADRTLVKNGPGRAPNGNFALSDFRVSATPPGGKPVELKLVNPRADFEQPGQLLRDSVGKEKRLGWAIDPQFGKSHAAAWDFESPLDLESGATLTFVLRFEHPNAGHSIGRIRLSMALSALPLNTETRPARIERILQGSDPSDPSNPSDSNQAILSSWYRTIDPEWQKLNRTVEEHQAKAPKPPIQKTLISSEGVPAVRTHTQGGDFLEQTHFLKRGDPNQKEAVATQAFLQVLVRTTEAEKRWQEQPPAGWRTSYRRRALANWITDTQSGAGHLLARVMVNRLWQHHLGRGIVATPSDFGVQGERPTNPELLDWLASELIRNGWRLKPIHRLIMTSAVYMQSSASDPALARIDPSNKWFSRYPRRRLDAEVIRDAILAVSGILDATTFGPGTLDEGMKRRSIYFFVKRSKLIPSMALFDAPNALLGLGIRSNTTIAPQALMLMNDQHIRGAARAFAKRVMPKPDTPIAEAVRSAYVIALGRPPNNTEQADLLVFFNHQIESYRSARPSEATELALADLCQVIIGLNEFVYVE